MRIKHKTLILGPVFLILSMGIFGCGLGASDEECFERIGIQYSGSADMRAKADAFCRDRGFDKASLIDGNGVKILTICCDKD